MSAFSHHPTDFRRVTRLGAIGVIVLGGLLLAGWALNVGDLRRALPEMWPFAVVVVLVSAAVIWWNAALLDRADRLRRLAERRLAVQYTATRVLAESPHPSESVPELLRAVCQSVGWELGAMWRFDSRDGALRCSNIWHESTSNITEFAELTQQLSFAPGVGLPGRVYLGGKSTWIPDAGRDPNFPRAPAARRAGLRTGFAFPITVGGEILGVMEFFSRDVQESDDALLQTFTAIGGQIGQFLKRERAEEEAAFERHLLHSLLDTIPDSVYFKDARSRFLRVSRAMAERHGLGDPASVIGKSDFDIFTEEHARPAFEDEQEIMRSEQPVVGKEEKETWPGREDQWVLTTKMPLRNPGGAVIGTFGLSHDITTRKRAEEALRQSEALFHSLVESLPQNIFRKDLDGRFTFGNQRFCAILGRALEDIVGKTDFDFFPAELAEKYRRDDAEVVRANRALETVEEHIAGDGSKLSVQVVKTPVYGADGEIVGTQCIFWDITERRRAEEALRQSEERFRSLIEATAAIVWTTPASGEFESEQPGWSAYTGQTFDQLREWGWLDAVHPDDRPETARVWSAAVAARSLYQVEHRLRRHDGAHRSGTTGRTATCSFGASRFWPGTGRFASGSGPTRTSTPRSERKPRCARRGSRRRPRRGRRASSWPT
jgi:PAS domain S-box-containing protein